MIHEFQEFTEKDFSARFVKLDDIYKFTSEYLSLSSASTGYFSYFNLFSSVKICI